MRALATAPSVLARPSLGPRVLGTRGTARRTAVCAAVLALALAGCLAPAPDPATVEAASVAAPAGFALAATGCESSGFASSYGYWMRQETLAGVWRTADIREEIGNPLHDGMGLPVTGPLSGNWHIGVRCATATAGGAEATDFAFGWVGQMVEPPAWDHGGADLHVLLAGLAFENGTIADALRAATTVTVTSAWDVRAEWVLPKELPRSAVYTRFADAERGMYESWSNMHAYRDLDARTIRFWWQVPADGSEATSGHHHATGTVHEDTKPVWFDLVVGAGTQYTTPPKDAAEFGTHNMLHMEHGPGILGQPMVTLAYEQPTLAFTYGGVVEDVLLHEVWTH